MDIIKWGKTRTINTNLNNLEIIKTKADFNNIYSVDNEYESDISSDYSQFDNISFIDDHIYSSLDRDSYV